MVSLFWKEAGHPRADALNENTLFFEGSGFKLNGIKDGSAAVDNLSKRDFSMSRLDKQQNFFNDKPALVSAYRSATGSTNKDMLANTLYIFLLMVFITIVIAGVSFGIREYVLSVNKKIKTAAITSAENNWSINSVITLPKDNNTNIHSELLNESSCYPTFMRPDPRELDAHPKPLISIDRQRYTEEEPDTGSNSGLDDGSLSESSDRSNQNLEASSSVHRPINIPSKVKSNHHINHTIPNENLNASCDEFSDPSSRYITETGSSNNLNIMTSSDYKRIDIFHEEINSPGFSEGSLSAFLNAEFKEMNLEKRKKPKNLTKVIYNFRELYQIKEKYVSIPKFDGSVEKYKKIALSKLIQFSILLPVKKYSSIWEAEKTINEIRLILMNEKPGQAPGPGDTAMKKLAVVRLLSVAFSSTPFDNPNYFVSSFSDLIELVVDTGALFDILEESNKITQCLVIELILQYCYVHWNFKDSKAPIIRGQFQKWKVIDPTIQNHNTIFRFLCNMKLGIYAVTTMNILCTKEMIYRLSRLLKEFCQKSHCNDYLGFIPMLAQAVQITEKQSLKLFFYELLFITIQNHHKCCMQEYLNDQKTDLKSLVQHGLWHKNHAPVCKKAEEVYSFILGKFPGTISWWKEVDGGKIFVSSALPKTSNGAESPEGQGLHDSKRNGGYNNNGNVNIRPTTPGAWNIRSNEVSPQPSTGLKRSPSLRGFTAYGKFVDNYSMPGSY